MPNVSSIIKCEYAHVKQNYVRLSISIHKTRPSATPRPGCKPTRRVFEKQSRGGALRVARSQIPIEDFVFAHVARLVAGLRVRPAKSFQHETLQHR
jgi:hypothetical protein